MLIFSFVQKITQVIFFLNHLLSTGTFRHSRFSDPTFVIFKTMDRKEFRVLIKHSFLMGKNAVGAKQWLDKHYEDSAPGKSTK